MAKVPVGNLKPGMKLSKPVLNEGGMILLGEGTELTPTHIERLQNMASLGSVSVKGESSGPVKSQEEMIAELEARFRKVRNEPYMGILEKAFKEHIEELYK